MQDSYILISNAKQKIDMKQTTGLQIATSHKDCDDYV